RAALRSVNLQRDGDKREREEPLSGATNDDSPLHNRAVPLSTAAGFTASLNRADSRVSAVSDILD
ncbi:MAG: hypothetical protein ACLGJC_05480, partial [Alphaproteobacteria bacterium]